MFGALVRFELTRRLKLLSTYVYALVLAVGSGFIMAASAGLFRGMSAQAGNDRILANGPHSLLGLLNTMALFGLFTVAAVFGQAAAQDFHTGTWPLIFTRNVRRSTYLLGRFFGAYLFSAGLFLSMAVGAFAVAFVGRFIDPAQLGPHRLDAYLWAYVISVWPMLFIAGAVFFTLAALTRQMAPVYVGVAVLVLGYLVLSVAMADVQYQSIGALLDPFGNLTFDQVTRYWTPVERNRDLVPLTGVLLANRALWLAVGAGLLALTVARFRPMVAEQRGKAVAADDAPPPNGALALSTPAPSLGGWWHTLASTGWLHFRDVTRSPVYWSFVSAGVLFVLTGVLLTKQMFGTATWPVTWQVLELAAGTFGGFMIITLTFYAGELVWKERDAQLADIIDATRAPGWVGFGAKLLGLVLLTASLQLVIGVAALLAQVGQGFFAIEWRLYATELLVFGLLRNVLLAVLALMVHVLVNHKYLGHGAMVGYYVSQGVLSALGVEEPLVRFGSERRIPYSDLNGYGHWLGASFTFRGYWWSVATALLLVAFVLSVRGREGTLRRRLSDARHRLTGPVLAGLAVALLSAAALGGYVTWQTRVVHPYRTAKDEERLQARFEKDWKAWGDKPMPRIVDVDVTFDLVPEASPPTASVRGTYRLSNTTDAGLTEVLVTLADDVVVEALAVGGQETPQQEDKPLGLRVYALEPPLQPGEQRDLTFSLRLSSDPLKHGAPRMDLVGNGTFLNNFNLPMLGYVESNELVEDGDRKEYGLPPKERLRARDDPKGLARNDLRADSDFIGFRATVSTAPDQLAIAPGNLVKEWSQGGRRYFRYEMKAPILNFFSVLSARYALKEDRWNDVKLQVFYDAHHPYNVDRMMDGMKDALAYCSEAFGPYQHDQARILEFPRYQSFAQSFPNTIPYSEAIGFIARVRDGHADDLDYPYYVTAHEIAHQWWGHQVVGADVQGSAMTSESMSQYAALMVMKRRYGPEKMRRFLKYELDRYLVGRAMERKKERPLALVENQPYIHYQKGSLVMYWLQDLVGEATINRALKKYVEAVRYKGPPYTTSAELISYLRAELPPEQHGVLEDLFETITVYDNRAVSASMKQNAAGGWDVTVKVKAVKYRSDEQGNQVELDFDDVMEVGALDDEGDALFVEQRHVKKGESELAFTVPKRPARVGVDPLNKLVDRTSDDNTISPTSD